MTTTQTITLTTEEGHEVTMPLADHAVLAAWPRLDMTRLVVVGDDAVHARRTDGTVHPQSLQELLDLVAAPTPASKAAEPAVSPPVPPVTPLDSKGRQTTPEALARALATTAANKARSAKDRAARRKACLPSALAVKAAESTALADMLALTDSKTKPVEGGMLDHFAVTGEARKRFGRVRVPTVFIHGEPVVLRENITEGHRVKVPMVRPGSRDVSAWALLPLHDFDVLRFSGQHLHTRLWILDDQDRVCLTSRNNPQPTPVSVFLSRLGLDPAALEVEPQTPVMA